MTGSDLHFKGTPPAEPKGSGDQLGGYSVMRTQTGVVPEEGRKRPDSGIVLNEGRADVTCQRTGCGESRKILEFGTKQAGRLKSP